MMYILNSNNTMIKSFKKFNESIEINLNNQNLSDLLESLSVWETSLLDSINATQEDLVKVFNYTRKAGKNNIEDMSDDNNFIDVMNKMNLRKSPIQNTDDFETFLNKPLKFMPIYKANDSDLENPAYLLIQNFEDDWSDVKLYKVNGDIKNFYDKLSSKTVEIFHKEINYIYITSNGNEWELKNTKESEIFIKTLSDSDLKDIVSKNKLKVNII
jgi:hypothetical protein